MCFVCVSVCLSVCPIPLFFLFFFSRAFLALSSSRLVRSLECLFAVLSIVSRSTMKLSVFALSGLLALAAAQNADDNSSSTKTATLSPQASCAAKECKFFNNPNVSHISFLADLVSGEPSDVCCLARCFEVPCPSEAMANDTTECAANCKQGDGSPKDTEEYARCQQNCFSSLFFPATATATGSGNGATGTSGSSMLPRKIGVCF